MLNLILASVLWAFSFGLIKGRMAGLDPVTVAAGRLLLAALVFSPFLLRLRLKAGTLGRVLLLGALQFGLMYWLYIASYRYLPAWMVALLTVFTPVYVVLISDGIDRRVRWCNLLAAAVAVLGALLAVAQAFPEGAAWRGVLLLQVANLCFALGQVYYRRMKKDCDATDTQLVGVMYWGAAVFTGLVVVSTGGVDLQAWTSSSLMTLLYLGLVPTAVGFYLWNRGAARVSSGWLAVANNLKIPLAVVVSWLVFGEEAESWRATAGLLVVVGGLFLVKKPGSGNQSQTTPTGE